MVQFYKIYSTTLPQLEVYVFNFRRPGWKQIATRKKMALCCGKMTKNYDFFVFPFDKIFLYLSLRVPSMIKDDWDWEYLVSFSYIKSQLSFDQKKRNP